MKFFKKQSFIKKGIIAIVIVLLMNFSTPTISRAATVSEAIAEFLLILPDGVMWVMQSLFMGEGDVNIKVKSEEKEDEENQKINEQYGGNSIVGTIKMFFNDGEVNLPNIAYTPYAIFSNSVPILNADFFGKAEVRTQYFYSATNIGEVTSNMIDSYYSEKREDVENYIKQYLSSTANTAEDREKVIKYMNDLIRTYLNSSNNSISSAVAKNKLNIEADSWIKAGVLEVDGEYYNGEFSDYIDAYKEECNDTFGITGTEEIIKALNDEVNKVGTTNPYMTYNFYKQFPQSSSLVKDGSLTDNTELEEQISKIEKDEVTDSVSILKPIVSKWYNILRTVAMVGLLSVLVYIGIRILLYSTSAQDKAKYKTMLKDWLVGLCLLFVLHFIMSFTMQVTRYIRDIFNYSDMENQIIEVPTDLELKEGNNVRDLKAFNEHYNRNTGEWKANFIEKIRATITLNDQKLSLKIAYTIVYIVIVIEVLIFTYQYIKRVITMAMLTLISPIVALTYPIDKITDGQAQGFNMWLKEYIFNALLQPMHLILYTIIISSAFAIIEENPLYAIVVLGCMTPMEKLLRKIFGFGKAESVGVFEGAAGAAVVMSTIGSLQKLGKKPPIGKEKDDGLKLWDNKSSIDSEGILLGAPGGENVKDSSDYDTVTGLGRIEKGKSDETTQKKILLPGDLDKDPKRKILLPDSVDRTRIDKQAKPKVSDIPNKTPIRNMPTVSNRNSTQRRTIKSPRLYALGQVGKSYGKKLTRNLTVGNVARNVAKVATGAAVGGALGTVGLATGIASGDLGKTLQYTTTAGVAGATLGSSFADRRADSVGNMKYTYQTAYASVDEDYATNKRIKEFMKNEQNMQYLESRYVNKQERQEVINTMKQAAEYGITDVQDVSAIYEMKKQEGLDMNQAIAVAKMSKKMGDVSQPKARKDWKEHFESKGYSNEQVKQLLNRVEKYQKERD